MQVTIQSIPANLQEFETLAASGRQPERICALFLCALALFDKDRDAGTAAMNLLRGPRPMTPYDAQFLRDRLRGKAYLPLAYFEGATPENGYTPRQPFTLLVGSNHTSNVEEGYCKLFIPCGGADDPRPIKLRRKGNGQWFLWEQYLITGIRVPTSADPWA